MKVLVTVITYLIAYAAVKVGLFTEHGILVLLLSMMLADDVIRAYKKGRFEQ
jgi:hypothetical protein